MDQQKIGAFLKTLRKEKGLTQWELAEKMGVSDRTVSRWETGTNMPDFSLLVDIADFYKVDVREILDGERKIEGEKQENMRLIAEYTDREKRRVTLVMRWLFIVGLCSMIAYMVLENMENAVFFSHFLLGLIAGVLLFGILYTSKVMSKLMQIKKGIFRRLRKKKNKEK